AAWHPHHPETVHPSEAAREQRQQFGLGLFPLLEDGEDGEFLEEIARHLIELRLARSGNDHAEVVGIALELRLDGEALDRLFGIPGDEPLLSRLLNVLILGAKVTAR